MYYPNWYLVAAVIKNYLTDLSAPKAPGPQPSFTVFDLLMAIELIAERAPIGRGKLSEELDIGKGTIRTLIKRLKESGLIDTSRLGCSLTGKGLEVWDEIGQIISEKVRIPENDLTFAVYNVGVLVKGRGDRVKDGLEQRDATIAVGARGATTLIYRDKKLIVPRVSEDLARDFPVAFEQITRKIRIEENDVVVIGSADARKKAEYGALAAAWTLI
jgi:predicted transcriptional regulator